MIPDALLEGVISGDYSHWKIPEEIYGRLQIPQCCALCSQQVSLQIVEGVAFCKDHVPEKPSKSKTFTESPSVQPIKGNLLAAIIGLGMLLLSFILMAPPHWSSFLLAGWGGILGLMVVYSRFSSRKRPSLATGLPFYWVRESEFSPASETFIHLFSSNHEWISRFEQLNEYYLKNY